ncbi:ATP-dependent RecD-like DNA helicase [Lacticaseibacillus hulanensis]|uniref:SF1B family DNA helicase RecD2 n=1 Tax=Lacticaseibacillus hulanensis TaxID=2493111 RepID=UPI000FDCA239|nr:ATP-dependent RecD-like DNA helicase [Lacticaseibacillus hulanensis]
MNNDEATVSGKLKSIFFTSPNSLFKILLIQITAISVKWTEPEIVVKGDFADMKEDETYTFTGHMENHPKYGQQFAATSYKSDQPTSREGLINYLASSRFPGIGAKTATKIVDVLGMDAIDQILKNPKKLDQVGLRAEKATLLIAALKENLGMEQIVIGLAQYGISGNLAGKVFNQYHEDALEIIKTNPYQLVSDIVGIGFVTADRIAAGLGFALDAPERIAGALLAALEERTESEGDTYVEPDDLFNAARQLLGNRGVSDEVLLQAIAELVQQRRLVTHDGHLFPKRLYDAEVQIARQLAGLASVKENVPSEKAVAKAIDHAEDTLGIEYDGTQIEAIKEALTSSVFVLTGGPGTGKTTIINAVVHGFAELHDIDLDPNKYRGTETFPIMLAAPTGRAAKRIAETTNLPSSTIHRLLGMGIDDASYEERDLPDGLLIVDEVSMVDTYLLRTLLNAAHPGVTIVLVGDKDQLPSVGPGQVFADILSSHALPSVELTHIHRQDDNSSIVPLAHAINEGELPPDLLTQKPDRSFFACSPEQVPQVVEQVVAAAVRKGFDPLQVQVLAPMYRGSAGVDRLNPLVQEIFNPAGAHSKQVETASGMIFRIGDKVLQLVNNPENNVYNGEIGKVVGITKAEKGHGDSLTIDFDGNELQYDRGDWSKITLAYATSIHKAQGSEFDMVILPLTLQSRRMLKRNLVYTAITRAKRFLILIGEPSAFSLAATTLAANRKTGLVAQLRAAFGLKDAGGATPDDGKPAAEDLQAADRQVEVNQSSSVHDSGVAEEPEAVEAEQRKLPEFLTNEMVANNTVDPLIGMDGITPASFMKQA